jgi:signal transduction histidine kinase
VQRIPCPAYGPLDGLPPQAYSGWFQPACWRSRDGRLWFTTVKGLLSFLPDEVEVNRRPPPVVIEDLRVDGVNRDFSLGLMSGSALNATADGAHSLQIEPGRHYVEFRFTGLSFTAPDKVLFRWRLEPGESRWHESSKERQASYGPLLPGNYHFRVLAANNDGVWNEQGETLAFTVLPYFWETWWFKSGLGVLLLTLFAFAVAATMRRRHRLQLDRLERIHEVERERTRIARDLHDDIGTSLTRINMLGGLVSHEHTPPSEVKDLTRQIRDTARKIVSELNEIVWAINPKNDKLNELLGYVGNFAETFCRNTPLRCRLKIAEDLPDHALSSEVRHNLFLAFKEAVNNAVKHASADELWVRARVERHELVLTVEDNGIGLAVNRQASGTGQGLNNMHQRLQRIGGQCTIRKNGERGTIVEFRLPIGG